MMATLKNELRLGAQALGLSLSDEQVQALLAYLELLGKWNRVYNLTAVREPRQMLQLHLLDSLSVVPSLMRHTQGAAASVLDVGSGGGLPGVVLAIVCPQLQVVCLDAVAKKASFVQQVAGSLGLRNLEGRHGRVEVVQEEFDIVTSRAFASLPDFVSWSQQALAPDGVWMALKGRMPLEELALLPEFAEMFHVEQIEVPGLDAERSVVWMRRRQQDD